MAFDPEFYKALYTVDINKIQLAAFGGVILALATSIYYILYGNILGMSGLCSTVLRGTLDTTTREKFNILAGIVFSAAIVFSQARQELLGFSPFEHSVTDPKLKLILSGLLVGIGTKIANGCTSGHGLCGMARFSKKSFAAVFIFLVTAIITATFNLAKFIPKSHALDSISLPANIDVSFYVLACAILPFVLFIFSSNKNSGNFIKTLTYFGIGVMFGFGLMIAGMSQRKNIYGFLKLNSNWNPALLVVLGVGVGINVLIFSIMRSSKKRPFYGTQLSDPRGNITSSLIFGSFLFGLGWGLGGLCPGPFLLQIPLPNLIIPVFWGIPFALGMKITQLLQKN